MQCRPWSDATFCGISSGSALFDKYPFWGFSTKMRYYLDILSLIIIVQKFHFITSSCI